MAFVVSIIWLCLVFAPGEWGEWLAKARHAYDQKLKQLKE